MGIPQREAQDSSLLLRGLAAVLHLANISRTISHSWRYSRVSLREFLQVFPFLPIDAGSGADRFIGYFARTYVLQNAQAVAAFGLPHSAPPSPPRSDSDDSDSSDSAPPSITPQSVVDRLARDAVYTLTYSLIMLNTDLNNPAVTPKMQLDEYCASCRRCLPLQAVSTDILAAIYRSIASNPLQIDHGHQGRVTTTIHAMHDADDVEARAHRSIYSSVPAAAVEDPYATAATAAAAAQAIGASKPVQIDWNVAFWNIVDGVRYVRSAWWREALAHGWRWAASFLVVALLVQSRLG